MDMTLISFSILGKDMTITGWSLLGLIGVLIFGGRWIVQIRYSRRAGKPVTPRAFWTLSILGSVVLMVYFTLSPKHDFIGILSNIFPLGIASYNLYLDLNQGRKSAETLGAATPRSGQGVPQSTGS